jgi:hypothetical protein
MKLVLQLAMGELIHWVRSMTRGALAWFPALGRRQRLCRFFFIFLLLLSSGCVIRTESQEHFLGPVWYRFSGPPVTEANISQMKHFGLLLEAVSQWGLAIGFSERTAISPAGSGEGEMRHPIWSQPFSLTSSPESGRWGFSLLYLRGEAVPKPVFVSRTTYGASVAVGSETSAVTLGAGNRTILRPPAGHLLSFSFDRRQPLKSRMVLLPTGAGWTASRILEEVEP